MDAFGTALAGITGLRVWDYIPDNVVPPGAIVGFPERLEYDSTKGRGVDEAIFPVHVIVGNVSDRTARDRLAVYCDGTAGPTVSVKAALDAMGGHVRVEHVEFSRIKFGAVEYAMASFAVHIVT